MTEKEKELEFENAELKERILHLKQENAILKDEVSSLGYELDCVYNEMKVSGINGYFISKRTSKDSK